MASASVYLSSADSPDCDPCKLEGGENEAKWHCGTCREYMCDVCHGVHSRLRMSRNHVTNRVVPEPVQGLDDRRSRGNKGKFDLHGEVSSPGVPSSSRHPTCSFASRQPTYFSASRHPTYSSVTLMNEFDASREDDDKPCWITGVILVKGLIFLADHDNHKIKVFNKRDFNFIFQIHVDRVYDVTEISRDIIAATSCLNKYFILFSLKNKELTEIRRVKTPYECWGICHHDGLIYVVCQDKATCVAEIDVFTCDGEMTKKLEPLYQGQKVLQQPLYITINHQTGTLYTGDADTEAVVGLSLSGKVLSNQPVKACKTAEGVGVDGQGQLYACGLTSHNVIRMSPEGMTSEGMTPEGMTSEGMSPEGMTSEVLVTEDNTWPQCLFVHGDELIIGYQQTNIVKIYKLS